MRVKCLITVVLLTSLPHLSLWFASLVVQSLLLSASLAILLDGNNDCDERRRLRQRQRLLPLRTPRALQRVGGPPIKQGGMLICTVPAGESQRQNRK